MANQPRKFPMDGPGKQDQETMIAYWIRPSESRRVSREWAAKRSSTPNRNR